MDELKLSSYGELVDASCNETFDDTQLKSIHVESSNVAARY